MREISNAADLRVKRTRKSLREAYVKLLAKGKKRADINVTNLTREAMINRKTFYGHYASLDELLSDLERAVVDHTVKEILIFSGGYGESRHFIKRTCVGA